MKNRRLIIQCLSVPGVIAFTFFMLYWLAPEKPRWDAIEASHSSTYDFKEHVAQQRRLQEHAHSHQQEDNRVVQGLTEEQIAAVNEFVGSNRDVSLEEMSGGGQQIRLNGSYRHAVVLRRNENGLVRKVEVGPKGVLRHE